MFSFTAIINIFFYNFPMGISQFGKLDSIKFELNYYHNNLCFDNHKLWLIPVFLQF